QVEAMTMADKIVVMKGGIIQQIGSPLELYNKPINRFVAGFIGSPPMNFLTVDVVEEGGKTVIKEENFSLVLDQKWIETLKPYVGKQVIFGIRPEDLVYKEKTEPNCIETEVEVIEPLGADINLFTNTGSHTIMARVAPHYEFKVGDKVFLKPEIKKASFFDKDTEKALN
ncbi:MAG: TOBE domain-containing protein, partial [Bacteroidales bacterium]|nr:TOBE domain-containing protein [Bacteroidales bacterium]